MILDLKNRKEDIPQYRVPSGCAIFGIFDEDGKCFNGSSVLEGIASMHERSNGLGGGFAAYGIYPDYRDNWVFHAIFDDVIALRQFEDMLEMDFNVLFSETIPTKKHPRIKDNPIIYRFFLDLKEERLNIEGVEISQEEFLVDFVMRINKDLRGAYIISSGKNMGIFKGVGFPEDIGEFFMIEKYKGYQWTSHGRFPTNSVGWWGGAHPFGLLDWSVVHNGEISSYGTNKRFVNGFGYECTLSTDTEVIAYLFDLLVRKRNIEIGLLHNILASPLWDDIERMPDDQKELIRALRIIYGGALLNGPFSIIVGSNDYMYALNDRIKLRPMVAARKNSLLYVSSEEAPIRKVCSDPDILWHPDGGEPVIGVLHKSLKKEKKTDDRVVA